MKEGSIMKRSFTAIPDNRPIKAATDYYNIDIRELKNLKQYLQKAYDTLDFIDAETFEAIGDGDQLKDDLDIYIRELAMTIDQLQSM